MRLFAYVTENSGWKKKYKKLSNKICERPHHKKNSCRCYFLRTKFVLIIQWLSNLAKPVSINKCQGLHTD